LWFTLRNQGNDDFLVLQALVDAGITVEYKTGVVGGANEGLPTHSLRFRADGASRQVLDAILPSVSSRVEARSETDPNARAFSKVSRRRVAVYQPWIPSMDEGWTRFVLDSFRFRYTTVHNADVRSGRLKERFDVILIPAISPKTLAEGYGPEESEAPYVGGLGAEGAEALRAFVADGGRVVCLDSSCEYAIDVFNLPVKNVLKGLPSSTFYAPGSLLRAKVGASSTVSTVGMPREFPVYFDQSLAFTVSNENAARIAASYAESNPLESGWLLGPEKLQGKAAVVEVAVPPRNGGVILFGFRPQHRGQSHGTFRMLFNALLLPL
jgi:hypothetical protein